MKRKPKLNVRLLRRVQRYIMEEPRRFNMNWWAELHDKGTVERYPNLPPCGTVCCLAGTAVLLAGCTVVEHGEMRPYKRLGDWSEAAPKLLGLPDYFPIYSLFVAASWPEPFDARYRKATTAHQRARIACQRIDHLIATGE